MNRYPAWKYAIIVIALLIAADVHLPNFFGEAPAVQVSSVKTTVKVDSTTHGQGRAGLKDGQPRGRPRHAGRQFDQGAVHRHRHQLKAKRCHPEALVPDASDPPYVVALNLLSRSPAG
jgi:preprotein translocase subunit SecD